MADPDTTRKLSAVEVRVLSRLLEKAQTMSPAQLEGWIETLPEAQQTLVPRLRERLAQISKPPEDIPSEPVPLMPMPPRKAKGDSRAGERVGPYRLVNELGTPGSGLVWLAERGDRIEGPAFRQPIVLMLPADMESGERQIVKLPEHANVTSLQFAGIDERGRPFRVMRHIDGITLLEHVKRRHLNALQRVQLLMPVFEALVDAHGDMVAHGDIRPANLRVDDEGRIWLLDWGMGRLLYPATAAADIQALAQVLRQVLEGTSIGPDLKAVLERGLAASSSERYATLPAMVEDLQRVLAYRPVPGPHATTLHRGALFARRHRMVLAAGLVGVLLLGGVLTMGVRQFQRSQQQNERSDLARAYLQQALGEDAAASAPADPAMQGARLQRALEQARIGFDGEPVLRGQVITELGLRFRAIGQPEQALAVLREAVALLQSTAPKGDAALATGRAQLAMQLLSSRAADAPAQARKLAEQAVAECSGKGCAAVQRLADEVMQKVLAPAAPR